MAMMSEKCINREDADMKQFDIVYSKYSGKGIVTRVVSDKLVMVWFFNYGAKEWLFDTYRLTSGGLV